jgi:hypothetical protein
MLIRVSFDRDSRQAGPAKTEKGGGASRDIDDSALDERPSVVDHQHRRAVVGKISHPDMDSEWQRTMRAGEWRPGIEYPWSIAPPRRIEDDTAWKARAHVRRSGLGNTIIGALEMSDKKWVLAVQLPGVKRHTRHVLEASGEELASLIERLKARCAPASQPIARMILTHDAGRDGFWLARFLVRRGVEVHVMQPSSLPVDRRGGEDGCHRRRDAVAHVDGLAPRRPRVCSMVPIPTETDEEARRAHREARI